MSPAPERALGWRQGLWTAAPLVPGLFSVGVLYGVAATASGMPPWSVVLTSLLVATGTAQWIALDLLARDFAWWLVVLAGLVINLRFAVYSMQLGPFSRGCGGLRLPYLAIVSDEGFALTTPKTVGHRPGTSGQVRWSAALMIVVWLAWQVGTLVGATAGPILPPGLGLEVAIPLTLLTILVLVVRSRPQLVAAVVAGGLALALRDAPLGLGLLAGLAAGAAIGLAAGRRPTPTPSEPGRLRRDDLEARAKA